MDYNALLAKLLSVNMHGGIKLGLENSLKIDALLQNPAQAFPSIHVAGTNGKGSVTTKVAVALQAAGKRVGLYTSPHISCFRERIRINGTMISESDAAIILTDIFRVVEENTIPATFFEITTLMAFTYFARMGVDIAAVETGLGGRCDATNILQPILSIITSISLEHTEYLGDTLEKIATEKAGIIKPFTPAVLGPRLPNEVFRKRAESLNAPLIEVEGSYPLYLDENNAIARAALEYLKVDEKAIQEGLKASPPCRMEAVDLNIISSLSKKMPQDIILDVAHNPDGIEHLIGALRARYSDNQKMFRFVVGLSKTKDIRGCLALIGKASTHIHLVEATNGRAAANDDLLKELAALNFPGDQITAERTVEEGIAHAIVEGGVRGEVVIVCGTFFIMGAVRRYLGIESPEDPQDLNER